ncbi:preprotein translocase subunit SecA [Deinococcus cellulosilyticus]|uniref:Protein translocase subunit SecA n=1 Tax=Deinococcus cellulosilyticus (strain DSM 18568 / NBRC 106333 / KACC 11606 / 5516J-15) TaxID=1223518 RepID=A0A511NA87_DEIC1|nr:preprotein translocase subunit SecA [Deinococcus cellulosilyticus]GEM49720.1 protein translocase subunit SecA [Deinococcus cellulosilyticus NBRC 106333 = KACC 11606]
MFALLKKAFDNNKRDVARLRKTVVDPVNAMEAEMEKVTDLAAEFMKLRAQVQNGEKTLDQVLVPGFALIREAAKRTIGKRHYDVQLIGGASLHQGRIAEMKTGEGKTLVATLALALNALEGKGCHLVTTNDYLAKVGAEEMGLVYRTLGLTVGLIQHDLQPAQRKAAYACDITYVTNSELGFDYLRDNMAQGPDQLVLRPDHPVNFAIVDEVDSILIDEARTPLIISGATEKATDQYYVISKLVKRLTRGEPIEPGVRTEPTGDYTVEEKSKAVHLTEAGITRVEKMLSIDNLYSPEHMQKAHMIVQALRAKDLYFREKDYIVSPNEKGELEVVIVDEFTGRQMPGRRYGEGLHQAIEAKEGVPIQNENQTLATITYQNFFRLYTKFAGMTGTAKTEEKEFLDIYGSDVLVIPTNLPVIRKDHDDLVYRTKAGKYAAVIDEIVERHQTGQPLLVGTASIETSEHLSKLLSDPQQYGEFVNQLANMLMAKVEKNEGLKAKLQEMFKGLKREELEALRPEMPKNALEVFDLFVRRLKTLEGLARGIKHQVLNAKYHESEANIIAQAGRLGAVTIATNMAGRGTDIMLGGNVEFIAGDLVEQISLSRYQPEIEAFIKAVSRKDPSARDMGLKAGVHPKIVERIEKARDQIEADRQKVKELGGLHIIGTERHESRRIDNQLRGRAGRQGDPGSSKFFVSFEDDLMRLFANDRVLAMLDRIGMDDTQPIAAGMVTGAIERAQGRVEERNFAIRKQLLEFDNVLGKQREVIYAQRREVLLGEDNQIEESIEGMIGDYVEAALYTHAPENISPEDWDLGQLKTELEEHIPAFADFDFEGLKGKTVDECHREMLEFAADAHDKRKEELGGALYMGIGRYVLLQNVDQYWKEHLHAMEVLRQGIFLRGYGQRDPFQEYKFEGTKMFNEMIDTLKGEVTKFMFRLQVNQGSEA